MGKQNTVALWSTETVSEAAKVYIKNVLFEIMGIENCILLLNDNMSTQKLAINNITNAPNILTLNAILSESP